MQLTLKANNFRANIGGQEADINLIDALSGKFGVVGGISIVLDIVESEKPAVPLVRTGSHTPAPTQSTTPAVTAGMPVTIRKGTKISKLFNALMKKGGATFDEIKAVLGMSEGGTSSYLYYYPAHFGFTLESEEVAKRGKVYKLGNPDGLKLVEA